MTLEVVIRRHAGGLLEARVVQGGQYGRNLLRGLSLSSVDSAKSRVRERLFAEFRNYCADLEIKWTVVA